MTKVKYVNGKYGLQDNDIEKCINDTIDKLNEQYGKITINSINLTSSAWSGKDALIIYSYEECYCNNCDGKCEVEKVIGNDLDNNYTYANNITVLDDYYAGEKGELGNTVHCVKIKDDNRLIFKYQTLIGTSIESTKEIIYNYINKVK